MRDRLCLILEIIGMVQFMYLACNKQFENASVVALFWIWINISLKK